MTLYASQILYKIDTADPWEVKHMVPRQVWGLFVYLFDECNSSKSNSKKKKDPNLEYCWRKSQMNVSRSFSSLSFIHRIIEKYKTIKILNNCLWLNLEKIKIKIKFRLFQWNLPEKNDQLECCLIWSYTKILNKSHC